MGPGAPGTPGSLGPQGPPRFYPDTIRILSEVDWGQEVHSPHASHPPNSKLCHIYWLQCAFCWHGAIRKQFFISLPAETGWPVLIAGSIGVLVFVFKYKLVISFSVLYTFFSSSVLLKLFYRNEYNPHHWEIHQCFILLPIAMVCLPVALF